MKPLCIDLFSYLAADGRIRGMEQPNYRDNPLEYRAWGDMKTRCFNPRFKDFHLYGGRGVTVCERWKLSFVAFYSDMGPKPSPLHSLDREDSDGNYEPNNCRWATAREQARNWKHRNRRIAFQGENLLLSEWAERLGFSRESLRDRLSSGWPVERALTTAPIRNRSRNVRGRFIQANSL